MKFSKNPFYIWLLYLEIGMGIIVLAIIFKYHLVWADIMIGGLLSISIFFVVGISKLTMAYGQKKEIKLLSSIGRRMLGVSVMIIVLSPLILVVFPFRPFFQGVTMIFIAVWGALVECLYQREQSA